MKETIPTYPMCGGPRTHIKVRDAELDGSRANMEDKQLETSKDSDREV